MSPGRFLRGCVLRSAAIIHFPLFFFTLVLLTGCGEVAKARRAVSQVGPEKLRQEVLATCREGFASGGVQKIPKTNWPNSAHVFRPLGLWTEPDGAYLLTESDAAGERGIYLPRIVSEKDPLCSPELKHEKLAAGVYWYDRKR